MKLIYKGIDITNQVTILDAVTIDAAGGLADSVEVLLSDVEKLWREWGPQKGDIFEVKENGFGSGVMYVHYIQADSGRFTLKGRSIPPRGKTPNTRSWENVRFKSIAGDIASKYGFTLETYGVDDWLYDRVDQIDEPDFKFLYDRCVMESCCLKIHNQKVIIYSEPFMEAMDPVKVLSPEDLIEKPRLVTEAEGLYSSCVVKYLDNSNQLLTFTFSPGTAPSGPSMKINTRVSNLGEAERFTKGWLRSANKYETTAGICRKLSLSIAAGNTLNLINMGSFSGKYFIDKCSHRLLNDKTLMSIHKVLEGY